LSDSTDGDPVDPRPRSQKATVKQADGKAREIQHSAMTSFWAPDGRPMSSAEFLALLYGQLPALFANEDELRRLWSSPDTRQALLTSLAENGYGADVLEELQKLISAEKSDLLDVLADVTYALTPMTREHRAEHAKVVVNTRFHDEQQVFLHFVLSHYVDHGVQELNPQKLSPLFQLKYRDSIQDAVAKVGPYVGDTFRDFQQHLYEAESA
jgi:type I restriction enzyme R subunit